MYAQPTHPDYSDQALYVGMDVHLKSWKICILSATREHAMISQPPRSEILVNYLRKHFPGARVHCVYEAGFSGFTAARELRAAGIDCQVVNPADIPSSNKDKMRKNDRVDARRLARELRAGSLEPIYIPSVIAVEDRALVRQRYGMVKKMTRCKTQIRMHLYNLGVVLPEDIVSRYWPHRMIAWLEKLQLQTESGTRTLQSLLRELLFLRAEQLRVTRQIRALSENARYASRVELLCGIPGIGRSSAMVLLTELIEMDRFFSADHLASFAGLVPREDSSGEKVSTPGITHRRNTRVRRVLIEAAWTASKRDPTLLRVYEQAARRMAKSKAIVLVARRLLNRIRAVLVHERAYELGMSQVRHSSVHNRAARPSGRSTRPVKLRKVKH